MTSGYLFVDGYNFINACPRLRELGNLDITICIICQGVL